jgi:hypothetical protein
MIKNLSEGAKLNLAIAAVALLALVVDALAHVFTPAVSAGTLTPVDGTAHDLVIGALAFIARDTVKTAPPAS